MLLILFTIKRIIIMLLFYRTVNPINMLINLTIPVSLNVLLSFKKKYILFFLLNLIN